MRTGGGMFMTVLYTITELSAFILLVFVIAFMVTMAIPSDREGLGCIGSAVVFILLCLLIIAHVVSGTPAFHAYRYDKIISERSRIIGKCPDMSSRQCMARYEEYRTDSLDLYTRYMKARGGR